MNNNTIYDIAIVGAGVAGAFASLKLSKNSSNLKTIVFDTGRPPAKRRRQLEGWLGCFPNSDGKLYQNDVNKVSNITGTKKANQYFTQFQNIISNVSNFKLINDKSPTISMNKKIEKFGYSYYTNDYFQMIPKDIHELSKFISLEIENNQNIHFSFDNEVKSIVKNNEKIFVISTEQGDFFAKKVIFSVGRSGWRWAASVFNDFGIVIDNDTSEYGVCIEIETSYMKDFNKSNCTLYKDNIEIGPLSWYGTVIPEDHCDVAISAFRSNENRWKTDKVCFNLIGKIENENKGWQETDRLSKLTWILSNDRVLKERVSTLLSNKSKVVSIINDYKWLIDPINDLSNLIPEIDKAYFHVPTIRTLAPKINLSKTFETDIEGFHVVGENSGIIGIVGAAVSGMIAAEGVLK